MAESFVDRLRAKMSNMVYKSLREQHAMHSTEYADGVVDSEMERMAEWLFDEYMKFKEKP